MELASSATRIAMAWKVPTLVELEQKLRVDFYWQIFLLLGS
jgi:hypothetical protein